MDGDIVLCFMVARETAWEIRSKDYFLFQAKFCKIKFTSTTKNIGAAINKIFGDGLERAQPVPCIEYA